MAGEEVGEDEVEGSRQLAASMALMVMDVAGTVCVRSNGLGRREEDREKKKKNSGFGLCQDGGVFVHLHRRLAAQFDSPCRDNYQVKIDDIYQHIVHVATKKNLSFFQSISKHSSSRRQK